MLICCIQQECIDKDLVRLTTLNIHPIKVLMIYTNMSFHSRSLPCLTKLELILWHPPLSFDIHEAARKKRNNYIFSVHSIPLPLLQNKVPKSGCIFQKHTFYKHVKEPPVSWDKFFCFIHSPSQTILSEKKRGCCSKEVLSFSTHAE